MNVARTLVFGTHPSETHKRPAYEPVCDGFTRVSTDGGVAVTTVVCIVGPSDSGKTTLVEDLASRLECRVATVKSIHHDVDVDTPGKDTYRHREAGAETVVGVTPERTFQITERGKRDAPDEPTVLAETVGRLEAEGYDVVLVEGFHTTPYPKIVLGERADVAPPIALEADGANAVDVEELVTRLTDRTIGGRRGDT